MRRLPHILPAAVASTVAVGFVYWTSSQLFHRFDWGCPIVKVVCFLTLFTLIAFLAIAARRAPTEHLPHRTRMTEGILAALLAIVALVYVVPFSARTDVWAWPMVDIGQTTEDATHMFVRDLLDPYQSDISPYGEDPAFWGFKYGPMMMAGYLPAAFLGAGVGVKLTNVVLLVATLVVVALLASERSDTRGERITAACFACGLFLLAPRTRFELFVQGVVDLFPVLLILLALLAVRAERWRTAGVLAGLSFAAKFSPAIFFVVLFLRRDFKPRFFVGVALGVLPALPFVLWDARAFVDNVFLFHSSKPFDSTSLYSITVPELHFAFPLLQLAAVVVAVAWNFRRRVDHRSLAVSYVLLLVAVEIFYREMHVNHLFWMMPVIVVVLAWHRHRMLGTLYQRVSWSSATPSAPSISSTLPETRSVPE